MYNKWFSNKVATQLDQGVNSTEVEINSKLSDLKPLHASWIVDLYEHLKKKKKIGMVIKGFDSRGISENSKSFSKSLNNAF